MERRTRFRSRSPIHGDSLSYEEFHQPVDYTETACRYNRHFLLPPADEIKSSRYRVVACCRPRRLVRAGIGRESRTAIALRWRQLWLHALCSDELRSHLSRRPEWSGGAHLEKRISSRR